MADDIYSSAKSASDALVKLLKSKEDQATSVAFADYLPDIVNLRESAEESPSFLALVIGVDRYRSDTVNNLRGASADADAVVSYLQNQLKIPRSQIINLRNEDATRCRIIQGLKDLRTNETIQKCSPILIYFAGHGAHAPAPTGWNSSDGRMQMIIPHDAFTKDDGGEHVIEAIPDRTIGALLDQLAHPEDGKGDNITVIFDCCFSGSGTRDSIPAFLDDPTLLERGFVLDRIIPQDLDLDIRGACGDKDRTSAIAPGFAHAGVRSHVLLAACSDQETAKEHGGRGVFTSALLDALKSFSADKITYRDLITRVRDLPDQTPQCEGEHAGRILFNSLVPSKAHIAYSVSCSAGIYVVNAGEVHGLAPGMEFSVYRSPNFSSDERPLGLLRTTNVHAFTTNARLVNSPGSVLTGESDSTVLFAFQKTAGQGYSMKLHLPVRKEFHTAFEAAAQELETHRPNRRPILFVDDADDANLRIALDETSQSVRYVFADNFITRYGLTQLSRSTPREKEHIRPVLNAAASFFQYLYHSPEKNLLRKKISIEFHELAGQGFDEDLYEIMYPIEPNLIVDGRVDINVDKAAKYGITIHNNSNIPLFVSVFYFDCSTLEIQPFYTSPVQDPHVPPLGPRCSLPIGYGDSGERPRTYELPDGQNLDVGFLRIFLSTCFVDLSAFRQSSVFASARVPVEATREIRPTWDAVTIAIIQKKTRS